MRKTKEITINDKRVTVKELTVQDVLDMTSELQKVEATIAGMHEMIGRHLPKMADLQLSDVAAMTPSEIKEVWDAFKEVNAVFFGVVSSVGVTEVLVDLKNRFIQDWSALALRSLKLDM